MMEKLDTVTNAENDRKSFELENLLLKLKVSIAEEKRMKAEFNLLESELAREKALQVHLVEKIRQMTDLKGKKFSIDLHNLKINNCE
tara:strand:+ start:888 stop:1148 length:261 start_codon:yes stop_codon:yes gene_type:complete